MCAKITKTVFFPCELSECETYEPYHHPKTKKMVHITSRDTNEPRYEKTCFLHMQKQRRRSASR